MVAHAGEKGFMGAVPAVGGAAGWEGEVGHVGGVVVEEEGGVVEPAVFLDVLSIATAFLMVDDVVVFQRCKARNAPSLLVERCGPTEDGLGEGGKGVGVAVEDEGDEEGVGVDDDGAAAAESADDGDLVSADEVEVEVVGSRAGDAHDDRAGAAGVDDAVVAGACTEERLFDLELGVDGDGKLEKVKAHR